MNYYEEVSKESNKDPFKMFRLFRLQTDVYNILFKLLQVDLKIWTKLNFSLHVYGRLPDDHNSSFIRFSTIYVYTQAHTQGVIGDDLATPIQVNDMFMLYFRECTVALSMYRVGTYSSTHQYKLPDNFSTNPTSGGSL